jgi:hypothetical protein
MAKLSYGAKTLILETLGPRLSRRDLLRVGGIAILSVTLLSESAAGESLGLNCCYSNCYSNCHSECGRKGW